MRRCGLKITALAAIFDMFPNEIDANFLNGESTLLPLQQILFFLVAYGCVLITLNCSLGTVYNTYKYSTGVFTCAR